MRLDTLSPVLVLASIAQATYVLPSLSFGHTSPISPNGRGLPGWTVSGTNHQVQLLSDRLILTPPIPGNARGSLWGDTPTSTSDWSVEFAFRASGQPGGTGNLQVWYAKDKSQIGQESVHSVSTFDGLVLVIDQYGNTGGKVRGFLNDGTQNYKGHSSIESLAFGHCDYSYRNLGRPSVVRIENKDGLKVSVDGRECFRTSKVALPEGYYFGITGATGENPDSFEVNKFVVSTSSPSEPGHLNHPAAKQGAPPTLQRLEKFPEAPRVVPDKSAEEVGKGQEEQFTDLHNRLQGLTHQVANVFSEFEALGKKIDDRQKELLNSIGGRMEKDLLTDLKRRIEGIESTVQQVQRDVEGKDYRRHLSEMKEAIEGHKGLTEGLPERVERRKFD